MTTQKIDEVTALREIFVTFFDTSNRNRAASDKEKLLVSMESSEQSMNPFHEYNSEDEKEIYGRADSVADYMYASTSGANNYRFTNILGRHNSLMNNSESNFDDRNSYASNRDFDQIMLLRGKDSGGDPRLKEVEEADSFNEETLSPDKTPIARLTDQDESIAISNEESKNMIKLPGLERKATLMSIRSQVTSKTEVVNRELGQADTEENFERYVDKIESRLKPDWLDVIQREKFMQDMDII